jgi:A/G-specific adenine glycosylase
VPDSIRAALLAWYDRHRRDLPWRRTRDPYAIWVSEVMLQQTRVDTVIPYYERFLARFPTVAALAEASDDAVLAAWSGLGYYRRARFLQAGARDVVERYGGKVPDDREARLALPGVGRYTAGAIGSIAFDRPEPILDGNVARVLSRVCLVETPLGRADTERRLWDEAESLVRGERPGDLNQALMELGALVCTPSTPRCDDCPVASGCEAHRLDATERLPVPKLRKPPKRVELAAVIASRNERDVWLVCGREALFGGLYSPPMAERQGDTVSGARQALEESGARGVVEVEPVGSVVHVLSHRRLEITVHRARVRRVLAGAVGGWVRIDGLAEVGVSRLTSKLLAAARLGDPTRTRSELG